MIIELANSIKVESCLLLKKSNREDFSTGSLKRTEEKIKRQYILETFLPYWTDEQIKEIGCGYM